MTWDTDFRPTSLDEMALYPELRELLEYYYHTRDFGNLLFYGDTGVGKSTAARIMTAQEKHFSVVIKNGAQLNSKTDISEFISESTTKTLDGLRRVIILDEFHNLAKPVQELFNLVLEEPENPNTYIFITNKIGNVAKPIKSRCQIIPFDAGVMARSSRRGAPDEWMPISGTNMTREDWVQELHRVGRIAAKKAGANVTQQQLNDATDDDDYLADFRWFLRALERNHNMSRWRAE